MTNENDDSSDGRDATIGAPLVGKPGPKGTIPSKPATEADLAQIKTEIKKEMSGFERATLRWTRASFVVVLATGLFIGLQWHEMSAGGEDTHTLAEAAKKQADKSETISESIEKAVIALETSNRQAKEALDKTIEENRKSLAASLAQAQQTLKATQESFRQDQRAWVGVVDVATESGTETADTFRAQSVSIVIHNSGKTPALHISGQCCMVSSHVWTDPIPDYDEETRKSQEQRESSLRRMHDMNTELIRQHPEMASQITAREKEFEENLRSIQNMFHKGGVLAPGVSQAIGAMPSSQWGTRNERHQPYTIYLLGKFTYRDIFPGSPEHTTKFCLMRSEGTRFGICPESNFMD